MKNRFSQIALYICIVVLTGVILVKPRYQLPFTEATLAWDVSGYYLYLPAVFIYKDLKKLDFLPGIIEKYRPSFAPDQAFPYGEEGTKVMKYSAGMALLYLPFFLIGHAVASLTDYPADGFSLPYQAAVHLGSLLVAILGLFFLRKNLLRYFSDKAAGVTLLAIALGTNFLNYATFDAAMPHVYLFTIMALLVHFTIRWQEKQAWKDSFMIGLCLGLAALIRPTEILFAMVPVLWGLSSFSDVGARLQLFIKNTPKLLLAAATAGVIGFIQLAYWKGVTGAWLVYSYQDQGFSFTHPHFTDVFFSYRKGWFIYTPLMLFAVAGFFFLAKKQRELFPAIFLFFLINTWIICSWDIWWYGGAFGQRAFIQSYALLAFPLAAFVAWLLDKNWRKWVFLPLFLAGTVLNLFQTYQAHWGPFETEAMTKAYYWRIFASTENNDYDRLLLDSKEGFSGERKNIRPVLTEDFEQFPDTAGLSRKFARSGVFSTFVDAGHPYSPAVEFKPSDDLSPGGWLHFEAWFYSEKPEWEPWWMPQCVIVFEKDGKRVKEHPIRPFRVFREKEWWPATMDIRLPKKDWDIAKIFLWNPRENAEMYMDDVKVETFQAN